MNLPEAFQRRMQEELNGEFSSYLATYDAPAYKGIRVNALKIGKEEFLSRAPFPVGERIEWEENGFYTEGVKVGRYVEHFAGLYYSQEPSAMSAAPLLDVRPGERVLDLCSAPGGKGTKLCEETKGRGVVVLNEYVSARAKILLQNVERMGISNAVVLNETPENLAKRFPAYFDKILVDAPCSGEGMFKKNEEEAIENWSEENVALCANRQRNILEQAHLMLKGGGKIVYSTCTFAREEDEEQIRSFLSRHGEYVLIEEKKFYPHRVKGEGHYTALLQKTEGEQNGQKPSKIGLSAADEKAYRAFEREFLTLPQKNLFRAKDTIYALPEDMFDFKGLNLLRAGVRVAEIVNGRIQPAHALAMSVKKENCRNFVSLNREEAEKYLRGETLPSRNPNGWCVVGFEKFPLGIGKISGGVVKNHYPKGLRLRSLSE